MLVVPKDNFKSVSCLQEKNLRVIARWTPEILVLFKGTAGHVELGSTDTSKLSRKVANKVTQVSTGLLLTGLQTCLNLGFLA